eukprot:scaffold7370_cov137-Skeletonema_dohrnii-CCMP3373.AAC.3
MMTQIYHNDKRERTGQIRDNFYFPLPKKAGGEKQPLSKPFIQSCDRSIKKLSQLDSIMVSKSRWGPLAAAGGAHYFSRGKVYTSSASKQPAGSTPPGGRYPTAAFNSIHPRTLPPHLAA